MNRILWDAVFLLTGSLFTLGASPGGPVTEASPSLCITSTSVPTTTTAPTTTPNTPTTAPNTPITATTTTAPNTPATTTATTTAPNTPTTATTALVSPTASSSSSSPTSSSSSSSSSSRATPKTIPPVKKFVAAAVVRFHFDDCPDSHRHFCFHGTCRFLILEETPACVCPAGFVGRRCEHADLLAVVAAGQRGQAVATVLVLCVVGCALTMLLCTLLHCWWRRDYERRRRAYHNQKTRELLKGRPFFRPSESVV